MSHYKLPIPAHFDPTAVGSVWRVPYYERAVEAEQWAFEQGVQPAAQDRFRIGLLLVDVQNTFCTPGFELFVAGRSGSGAVDDSRRLCEFIYRNLGVLTKIVPTLDTHQAMQIFHAITLVDAEGRHPDPFTLIAVEDIRQGRWKFNARAAEALGVGCDYGQSHLLGYAQQLRQSGKYDLTVWPYHAMLGGIGHALVSAVEEAIFFHGLARVSQPDFRIKGNNPLTEHYSVLGPEVTLGSDGRPIAQKDQQLFDSLIQFDALVIAGEAKSHCVAWTINDFIRGLLEVDPRLPRKVYLLEDCTSPVVIPGVLDYTDEADAAFQRFAGMGVHLVQSTESVAEWPGINLGS